MVALRSECPCVPLYCTVPFDCWHSVVKHTLLAVLGFVFAVCTKKLIAMLLMKNAFMLKVFFGVVAIDPIRFLP